MPASEAVRSSGEADAAKIEAPEDKAPEDESKKIESHNNQPQVRWIDRRGVAHGRVRTWQSRIDRGDVARGRTGTSQSRIDCGDVAVGRDGAGSIVASSWPRWDVTKPDQSWRHRYGRVGA